MGLHAGETSLVISIDPFPAVTPKRRPTSRCGSPGRSRTARNSWTWAGGVALSTSSRNGANAVDSRVLTALSSDHASRHARPDLPAVAALEGDLSSRSAPTRSAVRARIRLTGD
jgi:hypothetical protein